MSSKTTTTPAHARLSASGMHRWAECPGSVKLEELEESAYPSKPSPYAAEGMAAHGYAERVLIGKIIPTQGEIPPFEVKPYLMACNADRIAGYSWGTEVRVKLDKWFPGKEMFGTADWMAYHNGNHHLIIRDLKYGKGVYVSAVDNDQGYYYALGAFAARQDALTVSVEISQPRISEELSVQTITVPDLLNWMDTRLAPAVERVENEPDLLIAGSWCRFCKAKGSCPALMKKALEVAKTEFAAAQPLNAALVADHKIADALNSVAFFEAWIKGLRAEASARIEHGATIPGWKLVPKRASRKWKDETVTSSWLTTLPGAMDPSIFYTEKLKSPAQIEKLCDLDPALWEKVSSGSTLAPEDDDRNAVAVPGAGADFDEETEN